MSLVFTGGARARHAARDGGLAVPWVTALLALAGATCIAVVATHQQHAPEPPLATAGSPRPGTASAVPSPGAATRGALRASLPVGLTIPAIGVRSRLLQLGLTAQGAMEVPAPGPHYDEAGWYRYSPTPGSVGPAVIVGHVDSAAQGPSIFFRLGSLHARDTIRVTRADHSIAVFAVDEVRRFHKARFPSELVFGNTSYAALRLITCGGQFDRATGHYLDNIVVLASLVSLS